MTADVTTHRRHYEAHHKASEIQTTFVWSLNSLRLPQPQYQAWCKSTGFLSKLPDDAKARLEAEQAAALKKKVLEQQTLDPHLREKPARLAPYTDQLFHDAAIDWLVATDQPIDALTHPKFQEMVNIAARATQGVTFPNRAQTRAAIIRHFHDQINKLKIRLHISFYSNVR
ncbi:hypothetical protein FB45DRAFT_749957 [Roridomyces roridus]|uniref:Uncharacterized protein n=1 Tax=Roridomyces roridus TaxID=1738132 RepID=A0AAD7FLY1_9AGAR|nr:hypothetical protein FB45DRAFT_749957 [Roridomyces roridus]